MDREETLKQLRLIRKAYKVNDLQFQPEINWEDYHLRRLTKLFSSSEWEGPTAKKYLEQLTVELDSRKIQN